MSLLAAPTFPGLADVLALAILALAPRNIFATEEGASPGDGEGSRRGGHRLTPPLDVGEGLR